MIPKYSDLSEREARQRFYQSPEWKALRRAHLLGNPLCEECKKNNKISVARIVDHIDEIQNSPYKCLDSDNLQSLCMLCHNRKSAQTYNRKGTGIANGAIDFSILD
jgi:5-methylcytosine-specific restriction protein A